MAINLLRIFIFVPFHIKTVNIFQNKEECQMDKNEAIIRYAMQHKQSATANIPINEMINIIDKTTAPFFSTSIIVNIINI